MLNFALFSFAIASFAFLILSLLLLSYWKNRQQRTWLLMAALSSTLWSISLFLQTHGFFSISVVWFLEGMRDYCWIQVVIAYLQSLYQPITTENQTALKKWRFLALFLAILSAFPYLPFCSSQQMTYLSFILLNILGLILIEQLFRNIQENNRWSIKYLCLGLAGLFSYDFYLYAQAFLFSIIDETLWYSRGIVNILMLWLLSISLKRNPHWKTAVYISRKMIFHSSFLVFCGLLLIILAISSFYIRQYAGDYAAIIQTLMIFISLIGLSIALFSGQIKTRLTHLLNKYFYRYQYDYREEWLKLINLLSDVNNKQPLAMRSIQALADIVDSTGGHIFLINKHQQLEEISALNSPLLQLSHFSSDILEILKQQRHIIELETKTDLLSLALIKIKQAWLFVPLIIEAQLIGFIILLKPRVSFQLNWENCQLLLTASQQAASYLAFEKTALELSEARQFEGFNRLSAFVIHDLKNMIAQLSLLTQNAKKHQTNPEFIKDAFKTIDHSVARMNRLLQQLKSLTETQNSDNIVLQTVLSELVLAKKDQQPLIQFINKTTQDIIISAESDRLYSVIGHIIQNAQDATLNNATIQIRLEKKHHKAIIQIVDQGQGMTIDFIKQHLFKPFYTTKGITGMGIGAYECRDYIQQLGGEIEVKSQLQKGTTFSLIFPLVVN